MAEAFTLAVDKRAASGKGANRKLRQSGVIPGVFYNAKGDNVLVQIDAKSLDKACKTLGRNHIFDLAIQGESDTVKSLIWQVHRHPFKNQIYHMDIYGVEMDKKLKLIVPLTIEGDSPGKKAGGRMDIYREQVEIFCLPSEIPEHIVVNVSNLNLNQTIHVKDLPLPPGVDAIFDDNFAIVYCYLPGKESEEGEVGETKKK